MSLHKNIATNILKGVVADFIGLPIEDIRVMESNIVGIELQEDTMWYGFSRTYGMLVLLTKELITAYSSFWHNMEADYSFLVSVRLERATIYQLSRNNPISDEKLGVFPGISETLVVDKGDLSWNRPILSGTDEPIGMLTTPSTPTSTMGEFLGELMRNSASISSNGSNSAVLMSARESTITNQPVHISSPIADTISSIAFSKYYFRNKKYSLQSATDLFEFLFGVRVTGIEYEDGSYRKFNVSYCHLLVREVMDGHIFIDLDSLQFDDDYRQTKLDAIYED
jgi:hypothetical protein